MSWQIAFIPLILAIVAGVVLIPLVDAQIAKNWIFICPSCGSRFKVTMGRLLRSPSYFFRFRLRCPVCGMKERMRTERDDGRAS